MKELDVVLLGEREQKRPAKDRTPHPFEVMDMAILDIDDDVLSVGRVDEVREIAAQELRLGLCARRQREFRMLCHPVMAVAVKREELGCRFVGISIAYFAIDAHAAKRRHDFAQQMAAGTFMA
ncbi:MAG TPA: hypothetical protein VGG10_09670 [Rhizomicrobium sp.]